MSAQVEPTPVVERCEQCPRKVVIAGLPDSGTIWLAHAVSGLLQGAGRTPVWSGWHKDMPAGAFPPGMSVVRILEHQPALANEADVVVLVVRDLRDAVVSLQRAFNLAADGRSAGFLVHHLTAWEREADLVVRWEEIASLPLAVLTKVAGRLGLTQQVTAAFSQSLVKAWSKATLAMGARHVGVGDYRHSLKTEQVAEIERHGGAWMVGHNQVCDTRSSVWAVAEGDGLAGRGRLAEQILAIAGELVRDRKGDEDLFARLTQWTARMGAPAFQRMAIEVLAAHAPGHALLARLAGACIRDAAFAPEVPAPAASLNEKTAVVPYAPVDAASPQSPDTIRRLRALLEGKTVGFLLHGSSVQEFAMHAAKLAQPDVVWVGMNHFTLSESRLLTPVGRDLSIVFCCADGEVARRAGDLAAFLARPGPRLLITRPDHLRAHADILGHGRGSIASELLPPLWPYPNSLELCLRLLVQSGPRRIVLFGADGYLGADDAAIPSYFGAEEFAREKRYSGVLLDTLLFNAHMPRVLAAWRRRLGRACPEILNCSPGSLLQGIPIIGYTEALPALEGLPVVTTPARVLPDVTPPAGSGQVGELLAAATNAARRGELERARQLALQALVLAPAAVTPLVYRILQTDVGWMTAARAALGLCGANLPESPEHWRWQDLSRELREAAEARPAGRWDDWE